MIVMRFDRRQDPREPEYIDPFEHRPGCGIVWQCNPGPVVDSYRIGDFLGGTTRSVEWHGHALFVSMKVHR